MKIQFFCPHWGSEDLLFDNFAKLVKTEGYDGVEMSLPFEREKKDHILSTLKKYDLELIAQHWETIDADYTTHKENFEKRLRNLAEGKPLFINSQTGKDYFSFDENAGLIALARDISGQTGVRIIHETHRGKFSFAAHVTRKYMDRLPELRITLDASHWCNVAETLLEDQEETMKIAVQRADHIHARVGYTEGPQVPDWRDKIWKIALGRHLEWWNGIIQRKKEQGVDEIEITITTEFGPPPYTVLTPFENKPLSLQWMQNVFMMKFLRNYFSADL